MKNVLFFTLAISVYMSGRINAQTPDIFAIDPSYKRIVGEDTSLPPADFAVDVTPRCFDFPYNGKLPSGLSGNIMKNGWEINPQANPTDPTRPHIGPKGYQNLVHCVFPSTGWNNYPIGQGGSGTNLRDSSALKKAAAALLKTYAPYKAFQDVYPPTLDEPCYIAATQNNTQNAAWGAWYWCKVPTTAKEAHPCGITATKQMDKLDNAAFCGSIKLDINSGYDTYFAYTTSGFRSRCTLTSVYNPGLNRIIQSFDGNIGLPYMYTNNKNCTCPCGYTKVESLPLKIKDTQGNEVLSLTSCIQPGTLYSCIKDKSVPANSTWKVSP